MNRVICIKGHFYDGDKYSSCPHCAEGAAPIEPDHFAVAHGAEKEEKEEKKEKKGFFHKKEKKGTGTGTGSGKQNSDVLGKGSGRNCKRKGVLTGNFGETFHAAEFTGRGRQGSK